MVFDETDNDLFLRHVMFWFYGLMTPPLLSSYKFANTFGTDELSTKDQLPLIHLPIILAAKSQEITSACTRNLFSLETYGITKDLDDTVQLLK